MNPRATDPLPFQLDYARQENAELQEQLVVVTAENDQLREENAVLRGQVGRANKIFDHAHAQEPASVLEILLDLALDRWPWWVSGFFGGAIFALLVVAIWARLAGG